MPYLKQQNQQGVEIHSWNLGRDPMSFGRDASANAKIDDEKMSRKHFSIEYSDEKHFVVDLESTNGTLVNGGKVKRKALEDGDKITAGKTTFVYEFGISTMIGELEHKAGRSIQSELQDLYKQFE